MGEDWMKLALDIDAEIGPEGVGQAGALRPESGPDIPARFVVSEYTMEERDGEVVQYGDRKVYLSVVGISEPPTINHKLVIGGDARRIVTVEEVSPAGIVICWVLQVR